MHAGTLVLVRDTVRRHFIKCEALRSYSTACWTCAAIFSCRSSIRFRFRFSPSQSHLHSHLLQERGFSRGRSLAGATRRFEFILCYGGALRLSKHAPLTHLPHRRRRQKKKTHPLTMTRRVISFTLPVIANVDKTKG